MGKGGGVAAAFLVIILFLSCLAVTVPYGGVPVEQREGEGLGEFLESVWVGERDDEIMAARGNAPLGWYEKALIGVGVLAALWLLPKIVGGRR